MSDTCPNLTPRQHHQTLTHWFTSEILAHEAPLMRYLARTWRNESDLADLRQETWTRVYEAATKSRPLNPRSFLFATAKNLMADRIRRARIVSIELLADLETLSVDELCPERRTHAFQDLTRVARALNRLPARCRQIIWLRKIEGFSQKDVAARLRVSEATVEKDTTRANRCLAELLEGSGAVTRPAKRAACKKKIKSKRSRRSTD